MVNGIHNSQKYFELSLINFRSAMKKVLLVYLVLIIGIITWYYAVGKENRVFDNSKATALKVSKHSKGVQ
jgi:hypothetical protein